MLDKKTLLSNIPSVDELLNDEGMKNLIQSYPRPLLVDSIRKFLNNYRQL